MPSCSFANSAQVARSCTASAMLLSPAITSPALGVPPIRMSSSHLAASSAAFAASALITRASPGDTRSRPAHRCRRRARAPPRTLQRAASFLLREHHAPAGNAARRDESQQPLLRRREPRPLALAHRNLAFLTSASRRSRAQPSHPFPCPECLCGCTPRAYAGRSSPPAPRAPEAGL